jgi:hypothetical protein
MGRGKGGGVWWKVEFLLLYSQSPVSYLPFTSKNEFVFSSSCSYEDMESLVCDPFFITEIGTVEAYTSVTFIVDPDGVRTDDEAAGAELMRSSKTLGPESAITKADRTKYFDKIYEAEVWSFPDWGGNNQGLGVKSGFGR